MNQKQELWTNDVALFDYGDNGLVYKLMSIIPFRGQNLIMTKDEDFHQKFLTVSQRIKQPVNILTVSYRR